MKYFLDTEFIEKPNTIGLISIGIQCEDGRTLYHLNRNVNLKKVWADKWLRNNVLLQIYTECVSGDNRNKFPFTYNVMKKIFKERGKTIRQLNIAIQRFVYNPALEYEGIDGLDKAVDHYFEAGNEVEFYGYYSNYDWVVFCWIFGRMIDLPKGFPMYCKDLKQIMDEKGLSPEWRDNNCPDPEGEHSALSDAKWNFELYKLIENLEFIKA